MQVQTKTLTISILAFLGLMTAFLPTISFAISTNAQEIIEESNANIDAAEKAQETASQNLSSAQIQQAAAQTKYNQIKSQIDASSNSLDSLTNSINNFIKQRDQADQFSQGAVNTERNRIKNIIKSKFPEPDDPNDSLANETYNIAINMVTALDNPNLKTEDVSVWKTLVLASKNTELTALLREAEQNLDQANQTLNQAQSELTDANSELSKANLQAAKTITLKVPIGDGDDNDKLVYYPAKANSLLVNYITKIYSWLKIIITTLVSVMIVWGGIEWAASGGSREAIDSGREKIISALVGLALFIVAGLILQTVSPEFFGSSPDNVQQSNTQENTQDAADRTGNSLVNASA